MPITLEQNEAQYLIRLESEIDITIAAELKQMLVQGLAERKDLRLDLERATELDITALQVLWAAEREARKTNVEFTTVGSVPEKISAYAIAAGFDRFPVPMEPR